MKSLRHVHAELGIPPDYPQTRNLARQRQPARLVGIGRNPDGRPVRLTPAAATAWRRMAAAAAGAGLQLLPISGFRSVRYQIAIIRRRLQRGEPIDQTLRLIAAPGFSEHHSGRALDIGSPGHVELQENFARTATYRWLAANAGQFGFRLSYPRNNRSGFAFEPWHWCWHR
ncbi:MAG TPA: D-alanyl-D-alanine carboxypeptidase family protein [Opitutaceae bacterium]|nr:D-alanyl-D-alanine carboxypeptidase family protein [Opitutaceae bacterium]